MACNVAGSWNDARMPNGRTHNGCMGSGRTGNGWTREGAAVPPMRPTPDPVSYAPTHPSIRIPSVRIAERPRVVAPSVAPDEGALRLAASYRGCAVGLSERAVALVFGVSLEAMRARTRRSADIAFARQVAMYLAHTVFGVSQGQVAERLGRDRTTVKHACRLIEDRRDDPAFDARLTALEAMLEEARGGLHAFARALRDPFLDEELCLRRECYDLHDEELCLRREGFDLHDEASRHRGGGA